MTNLFSNQNNEPEYQAIIIAAHEHAQKGQFELAQTCFLNALRIQPEISLRNDYAIFLRNYGYPEKAVIEFKKVHQQAIWNQDLNRLVLICQNLCSCLMETGQIQQAELFHKQAICYSTRTDSVNQIQGAEFAMNRKEWDEAEQLLESALRHSNSWQEEADILGTYGAMELARGEVLDAIHYFWKAFLIHRDTHSFEEAGIDMLNLAEIARSLERKQSELRFLKKSKFCFQQAGLHSKARNLNRQIQILSHSINMEKQTPEWN